MSIHGLFGETAQDLIRTLGEADGMAIIGKLGGIIVRVPASLTSERSEWCGLLTERLGERLAAKLVEHYGGNELSIPRCMKAKNALRNAEIIKEYEALCRAGITTRPALSALGSRYRLCSTQIWKIVNG